ncbi:MAG TPA: AAA family ATPase [Dissulfurispiraceae bacterium]
MYKDYFDLKEIPFSIAPDPRYLYMSGGHQEALAHLLYGIRNDGGFVLLTGEVGTGKTTVCRCLLEQLPADIDIAFILNPKLTSDELLAAICDELGIPYPEGNTSTKVFVDCINAALLDSYAKGRKTVLIIEEAQNLSAEVLEQVRLLTNLETSERKLLQIIMVGQPELQEKLSGPELRQVAQRITARYHLGPLSKKEVAAYIAHRLEIAGGRSRLFPGSVIARVFRLTGGVPRLINVLCDRALLGAFVQGKEAVDASTVAKAAQEVFGETRKLRRPVLPARWKWSPAVLALSACGAVLAALLSGALKPGALRTQEAVRSTGVSAAQAVSQPLPAAAARADAKREQGKTQSVERKHAPQKTVKRPAHSGKRRPRQRRAPAPDVTAADHSRKFPLLEGTRDDKTVEKSEPGTGTATNSREGQGDK